jgi:hypothetical protein
MLGPNNPGVLSIDPGSNLLSYAVASAVPWRRLKKEGWDGKE